MHPKTWFATPRGAPVKALWAGQHAPDNHPMRNRAERSRDNPKPVREKPMPSDLQCPIGTSPQPETTPILFWQRRTRQEGEADRGVLREIPSLCEVNTALSITAGEYVRRGPAKR